MNFGWKARVGLVLSAVWLCLVFLVADKYQPMSEILGVGVLPLIVLWGILWAVAGWRAQRPKKPQPPEHVILENSRKRKHRVRVWCAILGVLVLGLFAANWQSSAAGAYAAGNDISYRFGEWTVYGLIAYGVFRSIFRLPPGLPGILATLVIVIGVNYKTHATISENHQVREALAKAVPLINKMQSDGQLSDAEVKNARVGLLEPFMLAQAGFSRDVAAIAGTYMKAVTNLQLEQMLTPKSLASAQIRGQSREKLKVWDRVTVEYKSQLEAATARYKLGVQAAQSQMPASLARTSISGVDKASAQLNAFLAAIVGAEKDASKAVAAILNLMDANHGGYVVDQGPPQTLLFRDGVTYEDYRRLTAAVQAAAQTESDAQAQVIHAQSEVITKLTDLLQR